MKRRSFIVQSLAALGASAVMPVKFEGEGFSPLHPPPLPEGRKPKLTDLICLADVEALALKTMAAPVRNFISGGAADEITLRWNQEKYRELRLKENVLIDVSELDCSTTLFGQRLSMPVLLAPTSNHRMVHPEGEIATARGAGLAGLTMVLSSGANTGIEDVMRVATQPIWFQLYVAKDRGLARALVQRIEAAGAKALCVTVDSPVPGTRNHQNRLPMVLPPGIGQPHMVGTEAVKTGTFDPVRPAKLVWRDIEWLRSLTKIPLLLKGIMNPLDADKGIKAGVDGIMVSNHGGRCLDTQPATIEALPRVADKVQGRVPVLVDGGIRRGTDVVKALSLGASAVSIGRPYVYGLSVGGAEGVAHVARLLRQELLLAMALLGRPTIASIDRSILWE